MHLRLLCSNESIDLIRLSMSRGQPRLTVSINEYQETAEDLEAELVKAFHKLRQKTNKEPWKPLQSLRSKDDVPKLNDVIKEVHENIEKLSHAFDPQTKSKGRWDKVKSGINKFVQGTIPALRNFMIATKDAQSVSEHRWKLMR